MWKRLGNTYRREPMMKAEEQGDIKLLKKMPKGKRQEKTCCTVGNTAETWGSSTPW